MDIKTFGVEMWMNEFENHCELNLAETCVDSISLGELIDEAASTTSRRALISPETRLPEPTTTPLARAVLRSISTRSAWPWTSRQLSRFRASRR